MFPLKAGIFFENFKRTEKITKYTNNLAFLLFYLAPLNIVQPLADINVLLGQSGTFSFVCDAFPAPKVTWYVSFFQ